MFTGLIEQLGVVEQAAPRLRIRCCLEDLREGDSIAVSGCCLTALDVSPSGFSADLAPETLRRTALGDRQPGDLVNLERSLRLDQRLGGHIVQGHVDGTGELVALRELGGQNWWLEVRIPPELNRYIVTKGSIAIDGISLTVASLDNGLLGVAIIPHTYQRTALRQRRPGDRLNLEVDILAKYVEKLTDGYHR